MRLLRAFFAPTSAARTEHVRSLVHPVASASRSPRYTRRSFTLGALTLMTPASHKASRLPVLGTAVTTHKRPPVFVTLSFCRQVCFDLLGGLGRASVYPSRRRWRVDCSIRSLKKVCLASQGMLDTQLSVDTV